MSSSLWIRIQAMRAFDFVLTSHEMEKNNPNYSRQLLSGCLRFEALGSQLLAPYRPASARSPHPSLWSRFQIRDAKGLSIPARHVLLRLRVRRGKNSGHEIFGGGHKEESRRQN
jgi:hypothetical protein